MRVARFYRLSVIAFGLGAIALVLAIQALHGLRSIEWSSIDARFAIRGSQGPSKDVVVVGIDAATFSHLPKKHFPFPRRLDALVIQNLKRDGASVIAYDEQFTEPTDVDDDNALILAVRAADNVVLATTEVAPGGRTRILGGGQGLAFSRATPSDAQLPIDSDGRIRRFRYQILDLVTVPVAAVARARGRPVHFPGGRDAKAYIDYRGPTGTIQTISYWRVLAGQFPAGTFRGKIVVVGATEPILHDVHPTATDIQMSGAEIQASAIDTVLRGFPLREGPGWLNVALVIVLGLIAPLLALRVRAVWAAATAVFAVVCLAVICQLAFNGGTILGFVYPTTAALLCVLTTLGLQGVRAVVEREMVRGAFARFVPESVVGEVLAQADGVRLGGVRREATVLFSDLRGFTSFAEQREPDETIEVLNRYLTMMSDEILGHGGTLVAYMGDGIMAVFGAPIEQPDHADRALSTARAMLKRLEEFNAWLRAERQSDGFKMGVGLNSGLVMSGNVGSERRLEYATIGDTTNTASRLEAMTKGTPHQLYIADSTYALLSDHPDDLVCVGEFEVRGRAGRITIWTLADDSGAGRPEPGSSDAVTAPVGSSAS